MNSEIEIQLLEDAKQHIAERTTSLKGEEQKADISRYVDNARFTAEVNQVFKKLPFILLHASELEEANSYQSVSTPLGSLIVSRDDDGKVHVFRNSCRHRGAKLVNGKGCSKFMVCPYHAWSYKTNGDLGGVPGQSQCFPNIDKQENGLIKLASAEKYGFIWLCPESAQEQAETDLDRHLGEMATHLDWMEADKLIFFKRTEKIWDGNWKLFAEGGLETYHFSFAHKDTIAPYFQNNTAVIDQFERHFRVVMPTRALKPDTTEANGPMSLHDYSHTLFFLLPDTAMLVQKEHVDWIKFRPLSADKTEISVTSLIPASANLEEWQQKSHWQKNHDITNETLDEDWELGVSIQASMNDGALPYIQYGRNEWALHALNQVIDTLLAET